MNTTQKQKSTSSTIKFVSVSVDSLPLNGEQITISLAGKPYLYAKRISKSLVKYALLHELSDRENELSLRILKTRVMS